MVNCIDFISRVIVQKSSADLKRIKKWFFCATFGSLPIRSG